MHTQQDPDKTYAEGWKDALIIISAALIKQCDMDDEKQVAIKNRLLSIIDQAHNIQSARAWYRHNSK